MSGLEGLLIGTIVLYLTIAGFWAFLGYKNEVAFVGREKHLIIGLIAALVTGLCWLPIVISTLFDEP